MPPYRMILGLLILVSVSRCSGLRCFECSDMPKPTECGRVTNCPADTKCYIEGIADGNGRVVYNSGCRPSQQCKTKRHILQGQAHDKTSRYLAKRTDVNLCSQCCDGEFCNNEGCQIKALQMPQRGPYCFHCGAQGGKTSCRSVVQCDIPEVCSLQNTTTPGEYASGCISPMQCNAISNLYHDLNGDMVGKRDGMNLKHDRRPLCCKEDFCNDHTGIRFGGHVLPGTNVNGGWSPWGAWSGCPATCGTNQTQHRIRNCDNPAPAGGGTNCTGSDIETQPCALPECPVNGGWSLWGTWSGCPATCGTSQIQHRFRNCDNPAPAKNGTNCIGSDLEARRCALPECSVNGSWSLWSKWSVCHATCGTGKTQHRFRNCDNPAPAGNGTNCTGSDLEARRCTLPECSVNGSWSLWSTWSDCSATCGTSQTQHRFRNCDNPAPAGNGTNCTGSDLEARRCALHKCSVDGHWSDWSDWTSCSTTCGSAGKRLRSRKCDNPAPQRHGANCSGSSTNLTDCPQARQCGDHWSPWGQWTSCSKPCGGGQEIRTRTCDTETSINQGTRCHGKSEQIAQCNVDTCKDSTTQASATTYRQQHTPFNHSAG